MNRFAGFAKRDISALAIADPEEDGRVLAFRAATPVGGS